MKGILVRAMKKWWIPVLVMTLAFSLTSCSKKRGRLQYGAGYGFGYCDGTLGEFDIYVIPSDRPGLYEVSVIPYKVAPGDIVRMAVANVSLAYRELVSQAVVNPDVEINAGFITETDLSYYNKFAIRPAEPGTNFMDGTADVEAICDIPLPGGGGLGNTAF